MGTEAIARVANVPFFSVHTVMEDYQITVHVLLVVTATAEGAIYFIALIKLKKGGIV